MRHIVCRTVERGVGPPLLRAINRGVCRTSPYLKMPDIRLGIPPPLLSGPICIPYPPSTQKASIGGGGLRSYVCCSLSFRPAATKKTLFLVSSHCQHGSSGPDDSRTNTLPLLDLSPYLYLSAACENEQWNDDLTGGRANLPPSIIAGH